MKEIAIFFGGESAEHDISVITGVLALNSIDKARFLPVPVYVNKSGEWFTGENLFDLDEYRNLSEKKLKKVTIIPGDNSIYQVVNGKKLKKLHVLSCAVNCMHGGVGENGGLSGLLETSFIPLASPSTLPSAVCMDKRFTKTVMKGLKINTLPFAYVESNIGIEQKITSLNFPLIVKPNTAGSSIGVSRAENLEQLKKGVLLALKYSSGAIIEPCLEKFIEINCASYKNADGEVIVSFCERPVGKGEILSFLDKYEEGGRVFPADVEKSLSEKIRKTTKKIYLELGMTGVIRADFFIDGKTVYVNEINTVPGSLAYYLFSDNTEGFKNMLSTMIDRALYDFVKDRSIKRTFESHVLNSCGGKSAKRL